MSKILQIVTKHPENRLHNDDFKVKLKEWWQEKGSIDYDEMVMAEKAWRASRSECAAKIVVAASYGDGDVDDMISVGSAVIACEDS